MKSNLCLCVGFFTIIQFFVKFWVYNKVQFKNTHNLHTNGIVVKKQHMNIDKVLTIKFHNWLIHFNINSSKVKHELLIFYMLYYTVLR